MLEIIFTKMLVIHVIAVMVAVGTVTVTDYLHIIGLNSRRLEKKTLFVFPHLSRLIVIALTIIYATGIGMVIAKPEILQSSLFWVKIFLVLLVTINGFILHNKIFPKIEKRIKENKSNNLSLIKQAAFFGSLSIVSWYGIVVLAMTKNSGYTPLQFIIAYFIILIIAYFIAVYIEKRRRK